LLGIGGTGKETCTHVCTTNFDDTALHLEVGDSFDVAVVDIFTPNLERLASDGVENGKKSALECVTKHICFV